MKKKSNFLTNTLTIPKLAEIVRLAITPQALQRTKLLLTPDALNHRPIFHKLLNILLIINNTELLLQITNKVAITTSEINITETPLCNLRTTNRRLPTPLQSLVLQRIFLTRLRVTSILVLTLKVDYSLSRETQIVELCKKNEVCPPLLLAQELKGAANRLIKYLLQIIKIQILS